jgi:hypothetical protein
MHTCLHLMYLVLVIGAMVFMAFNRMALGWSLWVVGFCLWAVMFSENVKKDENASN